MSVDGSRFIQISKLVSSLRFVQVALSTRLLMAAGLYRQHQQPSSSLKVYEDSISYLFHPLHIGYIILVALYSMSGVEHKIVVMFRHKLPSHYHFSSKTEIYGISINLLRLCMVRSECRVCFSQEKGFCCGLYSSIIIYTTIRTGCFVCYS